MDDKIKEYRAWCSRYVKKLEHVGTDQHRLPEAKEDSSILGCHAMSTDVSKDRTVFIFRAMQSKNWTVPVYQSIQRNVPDDFSPYQHPCEILICRTRRFWRSKNRDESETGGKEDFLHPERRVAVMLLMIMLMIRLNLNKFCNSTWSSQLHNSSTICCHSTFS